MSSVKSPTWDEPYHIAAALSYVETGRIVVNQQHPPLLKELSGLSMRYGGGIRWPNDAPPLEALLNGKLAEQVGIRIIAENGPDRVLFWARLPFMLLGAGFVFVLYALGVELIGPKGAAWACVLYALDPIVLGHTIFVATDVGLMFFVGVFVLALLRFVRNMWGVLICGAAMCAMLCAKFSAVVMLPVCAALLVINAFRFRYDRGLRLLSAALTMMTFCSTAFWLMLWIYLLPHDPLAYLAGMRLVNADHNPNYLYFLHGHLAKRFYSYYAVALALKEPIAMLALATVGAAVLRRWCSQLQIAFLLLPPVALFIGYSLFSDNLGVRYIIPCLPFLHLLGGVGLAWLFSGTGWISFMSAPALLVWLAVSCFGIYPDQLSYFNEAACYPQHLDRLGWAAGTACGPEWLDDSNVDWGQGVKQLKVWIDQNANGRPVHVGYFGSFPPQVYGLKADYVALPEVPVRGLHAMSAQIVAHAPAQSWLAHSKPIAVVGHAFYVYEVR